MSAISPIYNKVRPMALAGRDFSNTPDPELRTIVDKLLDDRIHGISFSPYVSGQGPQTRIPAEQIEARLEIIRPSVNWIRSFSCTGGHEETPRIASEMGLKTLVGAWLGDDLEKNEAEIDNLIAIASAGYADLVAVGNEVLLRDDLTEEQLIDYIRRAKTAVPDVEVGYVDAYFKFVDHPRVTAACDVILANCYPFWEGCALAYSLLHIKDMYRAAQRAAGGKRVIISETGWPNIGTATGAAIPSASNAMRYFINTLQWAEEEGIELFYFSSFDEDWKVADEGDVGAYWGLWDKDGKRKYPAA